MMPELKIPSTPAELTLCVSGRCNLRCRYCSFFDSDSAVAKELSTAQWLEVIREAGRLKVMKLSFGGAEPFLRPDLFELITEATENRMRFSVVSNGSQIRRETALALAASGKCEQVQISVDGLATIHDSVRGDGAFAAAVAAIRELKKVGIRVQVRITLGRHNLGHLRETVAFLLNELHVDKITTNSVTAFNTNTKNLIDLSLSLPEYLQSMEELRCLPANYASMVSSSAGPGHSLLQWSVLDKMLPAQATTPKQCRCSRIFYSLAIRADGAVIPCNQWPEMELGQIGTQSLEDIWLKSPLLNDLRRQMLDSTRLPEEISKCTGCTWLNRCGGTCPSTSCRDNLCYQDYKQSGLNFEWGDVKNAT